MQNRTQAKPITTEEWVRRLNALARQMDEMCKGIHPSAWRELTEELRAEFCSIVQIPTYDPPRQQSPY